MGVQGGTPKMRHALHCQRSARVQICGCRILQSKLGLSHKKYRVMYMKAKSFSDEEEDDDVLPNIDDIAERLASGRMDDLDEDGVTDGGGEREESRDGYAERPKRERRLAELLVAAGCVSTLEGLPDVAIENIITCNSDNGGENSLYVCVPSEDVEGEDGHDWADESAELGAVAVLAERALPGCVLPVVVVDDVMAALAKVASEFYDWPCETMHTVAFIGSYGKTTCSWLARGIFEQNGELCLMVGDTEYAIAEDRLTREGDIWEPEEKDITLDRDCSTPFHIVPYVGKYEIQPTTPDGLHLQKVLAGGADRGAESCVVELCPSLMKDQRAHSLKPEVVVFTNAHEERSQYQGRNFDEYLEIIGSVFESLDATQIAVINQDDPYASLLERLVEDTGAQMLTYGVNSKTADVYAEKVKKSVWETEILVKTPVGKLEIIVPLIGNFNVSNVLAAVAVGLARGIKLVNIVAGIESVDIIPGRSELVEEGQPFPVMIDAASTPQQLSRLIDEVKEAGARKTILLVGCPGSTTLEHRSAIGNIAHFKADTVFFTNDSPGVCGPDQIINNIVNGMPEEVTSRHAGSFYPWLQDPRRVPQWFQSWLLRYQSEVGRYIIEDRFSAIRVAIGLAKPKDVVIVAGRGHLDYMEYWDGLSPLSDGPGTSVSSIDEQLDKDSSDTFEDGFFEDPGMSASDSETPQPGTVVGWFDDRVECRNAVAKLGYLTGIKDLDRSTIPWTRYPEEREQSGLSATVGTEAAAASGQFLGEYLKNVVDENREASQTEDYEDDLVEDDLAELGADDDFDEIDLLN